MGRKSKAEERKIEILQHYQQVILDLGFENASIAKVAERMGTQPSLIMHYFKSKEEMVIGVLHHFLTEYIDGLIEKILAETDLRKRLKVIINNTFCLKNIDRDLRMMMYLTRYLGMKSDVVCESIIDIGRRYKAIIQEQFDLFYKENIIFNNDSETLADFVITLNAGFENMHTFYGEESEEHIVMNDYLTEIFKEKLDINYNNREEGSYV